MTTRGTPTPWAPLAALALGSTLALLIALLVLGRDTEVFPTYLVYTAAPQPLPRPGLVQLPDGSELLLRLELVPRGRTAEGVERLDRGLAMPHVAGLVLDKTAYEALPREQLREWRRAGVVLVTYGVDAAMVMADLERGDAVSSGSSTTMFVLVGPADQTRSIGNPSAIDRTRPFVGVAYLPPYSEDSEGDPIGWLAWFQADDIDLRELLVEWAQESRHAYPAD